MNEETIRCVTEAMMEDWIARAGDNSRLRVNFNIHQQPDDPIQRLFIAARRDSYFRPHRHPGKREFAIVLSGRFAIFIFDDSGCVTSRIEAGPAESVRALEIPVDRWHTWVPLEDASVFFEVKPGPYDPQTAAEFATWSPAEGSPDVGAFCRCLMEAQAGECVRAHRILK